MIIIYCCYKKTNKKQKTKTRTTITKVIKLFEYKKNNGKYWNKTKLVQWIVNKALLIAKVLYFSYFLLFLFNNATSY